ncbi:MAG: ribose-phosphate diphosphokinase, partial [Rubrobacter sp.]|nr:ribose-phosphate diphosphokinase [Rubrobacter sp.]
MQNGHIAHNAEKRLMLFSGQGYPELSERIAERLDL